MAQPTARRSTPESGSHAIRPRAGTSRARAPRAPKRRQDLSPVDEIRLAFKPKNRLAAAVGSVFGGIIPVATYDAAHHLDATRALYTQPGSYLALFGLIFSATTVYQWGVRIFGLKPKAIACALLLEGSMMVSGRPALVGAILGLLVAVNAVALACNLVLPPAAPPQQA